MKVRLADCTGGRVKKNIGVKLARNDILARFIEWLNAHKLKLCKKIGFLQQGTMRVFCLSLGSPSGNMPTWAGQDAGALLSALVSPRPSSIIARSGTYLYVRVTWPRELFCDAPCLKHCGSMNKNEWEWRGFLTLNLSLWTFYLLYFWTLFFLASSVPFPDYLPIRFARVPVLPAMCICGACVKRQQMQGITESVTVNTYLFIRTWLVGEGNAACWIQRGSFSLWQHLSVC